MKEKENNKENLEATSTEKTKKIYEPPQIKTEDLMTFGALCNGTATGGRKSTAGAPEFCSASRLLS